MMRRLFAEFRVGTIKIAPRRIPGHPAMIIVILRWNTGVLAPTLSLHPLVDSQNGIGEVESERRLGGKDDGQREFFREKSRRSFNDMPYSSCLACGPYYPLMEGFHKALLPWKWMEMSLQEDKRSRWCTGLDLSFLSSYQIHLDVESLKLSF